MMSIVTGGILPFIRIIDFMHRQFISELSGPWAKGVCQASNGRPPSRLRATKSMVKTD